MTQAIKDAIADMSPAERRLLELTCAADHWDALADSQLDLAPHMARQGHDTSVYYNRAKTYRRTAEAIRREARTGVSHCSTCGGPHANDQHGHHEYSACACDSAACPWCMERPR